MVDKVDRLNSISFELVDESNVSPGGDTARTALSVANSTSEQTEYRISLALEPHFSKERCNLCRLYFNRDTVACKVPIRRIMELKKSWDMKNGSYEGRRYNFPSYLYTTTSVCMFCAQFFSTMPNERVPSPPKTELNLLGRQETGLRLAIKTPINRTDIASEKKCYQSSEVDAKAGDLAVIPPYDVASRTKREVDPWWEVDFGRNYNIESLSFSFLVGLRQIMEIYIFLLPKPIGFEDPFLDNMISRNYAMHREVFKGKDRPYMQSITWKLPNVDQNNIGNSSNSVCYGVRIQIKGIQVLSIQNFHVYQGNEFYFPSDDEASFTQESFASLNPSLIEQTFKDKQTIDLKGLIENGQYAEWVNSSENSLSHNHNWDKIDGVTNLKNLIQNRYTTIEDWKHRVKTAASMFPEAEILSLYKVIFRYATELYHFNKENNLYEGELLTTGLVLHYPRCDLSELHARIRSILYWIQTRTHLKTLGPLLNSAALNNLANNSHEPLYRLNTVFKRVEYYWDKKEMKEKELDESSHHHSHPLNSLLPQTAKPGQQRQGLIVPKAREFRGCSWSQFLIIMNLFITNQCELIPSKVFNIDHPKPNAGINDMKSSYVFQSSDHSETSSYSITMDGHKHYSFHHSNRTGSQFGHIASSRRTKRLKRLKQPTNDNEEDDEVGEDSGILSPLRTGNSLEEDGGGGGGGGGSPGTGFNDISMGLESRLSSHSRDPITRSIVDLLTGGMKLEQGSWGSNSLIFSPTESMLVVPCIVNNPLTSNESLKHIAKRSNKIQFEFDSHFAEYRFAHFKRRQQNYLEFPKELSLEFAKTLNPRRPTTSFNSSGKPNEAEEAAKKKATEEAAAKQASDENNNNTSEFDKEFMNIGASSDEYGLLGNGSIGLETLPPLSASGGKPPRSLSRTGTVKIFETEDHLSSSSPSVTASKRPLPTISMNSSTLQHALHHAKDSIANALISSTPSSSITGERIPLKQANTSKSIFIPEQQPQGIGNKANSKLSVLKQSLVLGSKGPTTPGSGGKGVTFQSAVIAAAAAVDDRSDSNIDDFDFDDEDGNNKHIQQHQLRNIDFFRVCALCEQRLPRDSIEFKVFRKHIVKLRSSWDPKLVSKEVRSLDNTISMYNLVYVCYFCAQYFDPDFPDGIAYPTRIAAKKKKTDSSSEKRKDRKSSIVTMDNTAKTPSTNVTAATTDQTKYTEPSSLEETKTTIAAMVSETPLPDSLDVHIFNPKEDPLVPFYDTRHLAAPKTVGDVFKSLETKESRRKARRALEIVQRMESKRQSTPPK